MTMKTLVGQYMYEYKIGNAAESEVATFLAMSRSSSDGRRVPNMS